jgi:hypothetical protein
MNSLLCRFLHPIVIFCLLNPNILLSTLFSKSLILFALLIRTVSVGFFLSDGYLTNFT